VSLRIKNFQRHNISNQPKVCPIIIVKGLSIHISILKGRILDLQSSAES